MPKLLQDRKFRRYIRARTMRRFIAISSDSEKTPGCVAEAMKALRFLLMVRKL